MKRIRAACVPLDFDLRPVIAALRRAGCRLQVSEESGEQVVWVWDVSQVEPLQRLIEAQRRGELVVHENLAANQNRGYAQAGVALIWRLSLFLKSCPLASTIAALCLIIALMSQLGRDLRGLEGLFFPPLLFSSFLELALELIDPSLFLRSLTPALLHFGEIHLVFNLLWLFYFGRQIERVQPLLLVAVVYVVITLAGNVAQYYLTGSNAFGGLSGLIYGLVGYTWLLGIMVPNSRIALKSSTFVVFVVAMVGMALFASDSIASEAHAGGLVAGLVAGFCVFLWQRCRSNFLR
ncbi:MAG: rhomboid family intramembrane serine protease [Proteobacteria bacterium]|nr:rhomboid family intramembrane serine protease [Pseudomonadota bacterium]MDA0896914.1 rhomboid family intramembrane serine protease [Pseudomonadota bacterium]MDA1244319.1 rhomboid family intramembrane serine protease [Pseudomonadota bacterium]